MKELNLDLTSLKNYGQSNPAVLTAFIVDAGEIVCSEYFPEGGVFAFNKSAFSEWSTGGKVFLGKTEESARVFLETGAASE